MGRSVDVPAGSPVRPEAADLSCVVRDAQQGSSEAFRTLYRDTQPRLLRYLYTLVGDDAEDDHVACATVLEIDLITVPDLILGGTTRVEPESDDDDH